MQDALFRRRAAKGPWAVSPVAESRDELTRRRDGGGQSPTRMWCPRTPVNPWAWTRRADDGGRCGGRACSAGRAGAVVVRGGDRREAVPTRTRRRGRERGEPHQPVEVQILWAYPRPSLGEAATSPGAADVQHFAHVTMACAHKPAPFTECHGRTRALRLGGLGTACMGVMISSCTSWGCRTARWKPVGSFRSSSRPLRTAGAAGYGAVASARACGRPWPGCRDHEGSTILCCAGSRDDVNAYLKRSGSATRGNGSTRRSAAAPTSPASSPTAPL